MSRVWCLDAGSAGEGAGAVGGVHHLNLFLLGHCFESGLPPLVSLFPKAAFAGRPAQTLDKR